MPGTGTNGTSAPAAHQVNGNGAAQSDAREVTEDVAFAVPTVALAAAGRPSRVEELRSAVQTWTTVDGVKRHARLFLRGYACPPIRRARARGGARWVERLPAGLRERLDLNGGLVDPLRVEIGSGPHPSPGYVHVDADRRARDVEYHAVASALPFPDGTVEEVLAIHILEHVHASALLPTLREWRRVLRPGGFAQIHVPDAANVFAAFLDSPPEHKWTVMIPIFGMTSHVRFDELHDVNDMERHHVIYDFSLLERVLLDAGFDRVEDVSDQVTDRHTEKWRDDDLIPRMSLVVRAYAG
jgi:predicted SAM-dependent methyltransferase